MKALGADEVINYVDDTELGAKVRDLTGGYIAMIGVLTGRAGPVITAMLRVKQIRLIGMVVGSRQHQLDLIRAVETTGIKPVLDKSFPLANLADAFRHQAANAHFGKIVVEI